VTQVEGAGSKELTLLELILVLRTMAPLEEVNIESGIFLFNSFGAPKVWDNLT
jgi:hypothetical protein